MFCEPRGRLQGRVHLRTFFALLNHGSGIANLPDSFAVRRTWNHTGSQNHQVGLDLNIISDKGVLHIHQKVIAVRFSNRGHVTLCEHYPYIFLRPAIEVLVLPRRTDILIEYVDFHLAVEFSCQQRLLQRHPAADHRTVGQVLLIPGAGALNKSDTLGRLVVGRAVDLAQRQQLLHLNIGDNIRAAVSEMTELGRVIGLPAGGLNDGANPEIHRRPVALDRHIELAWLAADFLD